MNIHFVWYVNVKGGYYLKQWLNFLSDSNYLIFSIHFNVRYIQALINTFWCLKVKTTQSEKSAPTTEEQCNVLSLISTQVEMGCTGQFGVQDSLGKYALARRNTKPLIKASHATFVTLWHHQCGLFPKRRSFCWLDDRWSLLRQWKEKTQNGPRVNLLNVVQGQCFQFYSTLGSNVSRFMI